MVNGKPPVFEILDQFTVRYTWDGPNPDFMPWLAAAQPLAMVMPAHYLKQFHAKYQDAEKLEALIKENKVKNWPRLHINMSRQYRPENPDLPMLDPWVNTTKPPAEQFIMERNPYFHRVDRDGRQLPYFDRFVFNVSSSQLIPAKTGAGETDLQATNIQFEDYTFLKEAEKRHGIKVHLWERTQGSRVALLPNLNYEDEKWRSVLQDTRFRRALSLAIDRREINMATFFGLGHPSADTMLPQSPLFRPEYRDAWIAHDPAQANALLDEMGLDKRDDDGWRHIAGRAHRASHRRIGWRQHARYRRARTHCRLLARNRHPALYPHLADRRAAQPGIGRAGDDVDLVRHRQWPRQCRHESGRPGADRR